MQVYISYYSINMECFESLRRADIYAIGLLYWEVCRRTIGSCKIAEEYKGKCLHRRSIFFYLNIAQNILP